MPATTDPVRRTVLFSGQVQGVGFRYTTRSVARDFPVTGYVRNTRDGRVELVIEGPPDEVDGFIRAVQAEMGGYIRDPQVETGPATGEFPDFRIRY